MTTNQKYANTPPELVETLIVAGSHYHGFSSDYIARTVVSKGLRRDRESKRALHTGVRSHAKERANPFRASAIRSSMAGFVLICRLVGSDLRTSIESGRITGKRKHSAVLVP